MLKRGLSLCLIAAMLMGLFVAVPLTVRAASDMVTSEECIAVIKEFEGFSGSAYVDTDGLHTIGYGTRCPEDMVEYYKSYPMTKEEADAEMRRVVAEYEVAVNKFLDRHGITFTQGQFDGVISMVYNCGAGWLTKGSTLISALTNQNVSRNELIHAFTIYSMSGGVRSLGHINRRQAEANMYLNGEYQRKAPASFSYVLYKTSKGELNGYNVQGYHVEDTAKPTTSATYEGYDFLGWYTAPSGGQKVTVLDASTRGITLYAQWKKAEPKPVTPTDPTDPTEATKPAETTKPSATTKPTVPETTAPDASDESVLVKVTGSKVNVRSGPGLDYSTVTQAVKGDKLSITATKQADGYLWGKYEQGWVALKYTTYDEVIAQKPAEPVVKTYATVILTDTLNVRAEPDGTVVGQLKRGDRVEILEQGTYNGRLWGRFKDGWICMRSYVKLETVTEDPNSISVDATEEPKASVIFMGTVVNTEYQNVRLEPYGKIVAKLAGGDRVAILEQRIVDGCPWGRIESGWVCLRTYIRLDDQEQNSGSALGKTMKVTASCLNVRSGAGTSNAIVDQLYCGQSVEILETTYVGATPWARTANGWVCMNYLA